MFREVKKEETFPQIEERVLGLWDKDESFKKSLDSRPETEPYTFYDGPPFAPLITEESKPKRNPPMAAAKVIKIMWPICSFFWDMKTPFF